jgi:hypothetical protein
VVLPLLLGFGVVACGGEQAEPSKAFAADWTVVCTDEADDVKEIATIGEKSENPNLLASADLVRAVVKPRDVDSDGVVQSLEIGIKVRNTGNFPREIERSGGSSQGQFVKSSVMMRFTPDSGYQSSVTFKLEIDASGEYGKISLFKGGDIAAFPVSYADGVFVGVVPVAGLTVSDADQVDISSLTSWSMSQGFVFSAMDDSTSCVKQSE